MYFDNECIVESQKKAEKMNAHFASISKAAELTENDKTDLKDLKTKEKAPGANQAIFEEQFTFTMPYQFILDDRNCPKKLEKCYPFTYFEEKQTP